MERNNFNLELLRKPTLTMIHSIIEDALKTPSADNSQPWRFHWDGGKLQIHYAKKIAQHALNRQERTSVLTLGTVIEAIRISASRFSLSAKPRLLLETEGEMPVWAEVQFNFVSKNPNRLAAVISRRATDRRVFHGGELDAEILQKFRDIESEFPGFSIRTQAKPDSAFMSYYLKSEGLFWRNTKVVRDVTKWLRLTRSEVTQSTDGMSAKNIGLNPMDTLMFRIFRMLPVLPKLLWHFGFGLVVKSKMKAGIRSSASLICISAPKADLESLFKVGKIGYRTWLILNANRFGVQPLSYCSLSVADFQAGVLDEENDAAEFDLFEKGRNILRKTFQLKASQVPVWVFRTGLSSELPEDMGAPKHHITKVIV